MIAIQNKTKNNAGFEHEFRLSQCEWCVLVLGYGLRWCQERCSQNDRIKLEFMGGVVYLNQGGWCLNEVGQMFELGGGAAG